MHKKSLQTAGEAIMPGPSYGNFILKDKVSPPDGPRTFHEAIFKSVLYQA